MLQVQPRPAMASGRHLDPESPMNVFGYNFSDDDFSFFQNAPQPPPGASILSANEQCVLNSWFEGMKNDDRTGGFLHSDNWIDDLPQLVGSASSFGQPHDLSQQQQHAVLGDQILSSQDFLSQLPLVFSPNSNSSATAARPPLGPAVGIVSALTPSSTLPSSLSAALPTALPTASRSNSTPTLPMHLFAGLDALDTSPSQQPQHTLDPMVAAANALLNSNDGSGHNQHPNAHPGSRHASFHYIPRLHLAQPSSSHHGLAGLELATPPPSAPSAASAHSAASAAPPSASSATPQQGQQQARPASVASAASPSALLPIAAPPLRTTRLPSTSAVTPAGLVYVSEASVSPRQQQPPVSVASSSATAAPAVRGELQWGTDDSFGQVQFTPRSNRETSEALMSLRFKSMGCLAPDLGAAAGLARAGSGSSGAGASVGGVASVSGSGSVSSRPTSPARAYEGVFAPLHSSSTSSRLVKAHTASFVSMGGDTSEGVLPNASAGASGALDAPRKRRKALRVDEYGLPPCSASGGAGQDDDDSAAAGGKGALRARKRKAKTVLVVDGAAALAGRRSSTTPGSPGAAAGAEAGAVDNSGSSGPLATAPAPAAKRRRSAAAAAKPPRENLTEEQKRENHIKSEQKRRTLIKTGFDDLCVLVPGLQGGNLSKSLVLTTAAAWLTELLEGNRRLQAQLTALGGGYAA